MNRSLESLMPDLRAQPAGRTLFEELVLFILVGASGAIGFVLLSTTMQAMPTGLPRWVVSALCYAACIGPVYLSHRRFSFQSGAPHRQALPRYVAVQGMALTLAALFSYVAYGVLSAPALAGSVLVVGLTSGVNFIILRGWAFAHPA